MQKKSSFVICAFLVMCAVLRSEPSLRAQVKELFELGQTVERDIRGGEQHIYEVNLLPGQYIQIAVEIRGTEDILPLLVDPTGRPQIAGGFTAARTYVPFVASFIATQPGPHEIMLRPIRPPIGADHYKMTLEAARPATEKDRALIAEIEAFRGLLLELGRTSNNQQFDSITDDFEKLVQHAEKVDPRDANFSILYAFSATLTKRLVDGGRAELAETILKRIVELFDRTQGPASFMTVQSLAVLLDFYVSQKRLVDGLPVVQRMATILKDDFSTADPRRLAFMFMRVGEAYFSLASYNGAIPPLNQAWDLIKTTPGIADADVYAVRIGYEIGISYLRTGRTVMAKPLIEAAVAESEKRTLAPAILQDRLYALTRLRLSEQGHPNALGETLNPDWMLKTVDPELDRIAKSSNGDHKKWLRDFLTKASDSEVKRRLLDEVDQ